VIDVEVWTGREALRLRTALRMSQREFAAHLGVSERTVAKWDSRGAETKPRGEFQRMLDTALAHAPVEAQERFRARPGDHSSDAPRRPSPRARPVPQLLPTAEVDVFVGSPADTVRTDRAAMESFRAADSQVGGGVLYASVLNYLRSRVGPRLLGLDAVGTGQRAVFQSAAALTEMAGWMAHDAGRGRSAGAHFQQSLALAKVSGDQQLAAHVYGSLSHLANHAGRAEEAITLARRGLKMMDDTSANQDVQARLYAMEARGRAAQRDAEACMELLGQAERAMARPPLVEPSPWVAHFDAGSLASETARCMRLLGDWAEAQRQAEQIMALRPSSRARSRAFGQLALVTALIAREEVEEACAIAASVVDATKSLASSLVTQELAIVQRMLLPYQTTTAVKALQPVLADALQERAWLAQAVDHDEQGV
jgi:transcriptional regulator with XRE-family HTH domain